MTEEPEADVMEQIQNIADNLVNDEKAKDNPEEDDDAGKNQEEEENEAEKNQEEENEAEKSQEEEENEAEKNQEEENKAEKNREEEENETEKNQEEEELNNHDEAKEEEKGSIAVTEPTTASDSCRHKRSRKKQLDKDIEVIIPDLPFAPQPKDPNITHFIFDYDDGSSNQNMRRRNSNSKRSSFAQSSRPATKGGSIYDNSPYFSKQFTIYKVPNISHPMGTSQTIHSSRSRSIDKSMSTTRNSNYSNSNNNSTSYKSARSNYPTSSRKRYSTKPPPPSNYVERTRQFDEIQRKYDAKLIEKYKVAYPLPLYQPHYQKTVLELKIEKQRREESRYRKAAEAAKRKRIQDRKEHEKFIKKTQDFENEQRFPKYLESANKKPNYLDLDFELEEEEEEKKEEENAEEESAEEKQSEKGELENKVDDLVSNLVLNEEEEKKEEEEEEKKDGEEEEKNEEEEKKDEEEELNEVNHDKEEEEENVEKEE